MFMALNFTPVTSLRADEVQYQVGLYRAMSRNLRMLAATGDVRMGLQTLN